MGFNYVEAAATRNASPVYHGMQLPSDMFAFLHIVTLTGNTLGRGLFNGYLYDADRVGWDSGLAFLTGAGMISVTLLSLVEIYFCVVQKHRKQEERRLQEERAVVEAEENEGLLK